jgi:hypothetical protein
MPIDFRVKCRKFARNVNNKEICWSLFKSRLTTAVKFGFLPWVFSWVSTVRFMLGARFSWNSVLTACHWKPPILALLRPLQSKYYRSGRTNVHGRKRTSGIWCRVFEFCMVVNVWNVDNSIFTEKQRLDEMSWFDEDIWSIYETN